MDEKKQQRSYFRIETEIPLRQRRISRKEAEIFERELAVGGGGPAVDPALGAWFERIERKLDRILAHLEPDADVPVGESDRRPVVLSGSGARYECSDPVQVGDTLLVEMLVPGTPPLRVRTVAEVVRRVDTPDSKKAASIAVAFRVIRASDQDAIVRYTYDVQRAARGASGVLARG